MWTSVHYVSCLMWCSRRVSACALLALGHDVFSDSSGIHGDCTEPCFTKNVWKTGSGVPVVHPSLGRIKRLRSVCRLHATTVGVAKQSCRSSRNWFFAQLESERECCAHDCCRFLFWRCVLNIPLQPWELISTDFTICTVDPSDVRAAK